MRLSRGVRKLVCGVLVAPLVLACGATREAAQIRGGDASATATRVVSASQPGPTAKPTIVASAPTPGGSSTITPRPEANPTTAPASASAPRPSSGMRAQGVDPATITLGLEPLPARLNRPVHIVHAGDGSGRLFVAEKPGRIVIMRDGSAAPTAFLDITSIVGSSGSEQGLLGLAFHPQYASNGRFFVNYTNRNGDTVVARYQVSADPNVADPATARVLFQVDQPAANHNGGNLVFGPDGYLWIGLGDGGGAGDRFGNGQNRQALLGKMLRIDVDNGDPYAIPPDNPFVGAPDARPEIWAIGLRNPWRYSFDRASGDLFIADVGQNAYEEIHLQRAGSGSGANYGWPRMEGKHCYPVGSRCDPSGLEQPVAEYGRDGGCSVTGGYVYRGSAFSQLSGLYLFGDFCSGIIWSLDEPSPGNWRMVQLMKSPLQISTFGEDEAGELYVASLHDNRVYRITAS